MTIQQSEDSGLTVVSPLVPQVWSTGTDRDGVDERLELARLDSGRRIAVRDARHPIGPALLFNLGDWNSLIGREPDLVDLR